MVARSRLFQTVCARSVCLLAACLAGVGGCGESGAGRVAVEGSVTVDGSPLPAGSIVFVPAAGASGPKAAGEIIDGRYQIDRDAGPSIGPHKVEVYETASLGYALDDPREFAAKAPARQPANAIAAEFNRSSKLSAATTGDGPNRFDFAVRRSAK